MPTNKPFSVSVVVTTYNGSPWIELAVASILEQTQVQVESVIVVDDVSTDDTCERVQSIGDNRVRLVRMDKNGGVAAARNRGLAEVTSEWVAFNDQDDAWLPDKLLRQVQLLDCYPDAAAVVGGEARLARDGRSRWSWGIRPFIWSPEHLPSLARPPYYNPMTDGGVYLQSLMVRTEVARHIGGFKTTLVLADDTDFILRVVEAATQTVAVVEPVFLYRLGDHNQTAPGRVKAKAFLAARAYLDDAQRARLGGSPEPDPKTYIDNYVPTQTEISQFFLNQEVRLVNTLWVNHGLWQALQRFLSRTIFMKGTWDYVYRATRRSLVSRWFGRHRAL